MVKARVNTRHSRAVKVGIRDLLKARNLSVMEIIMAVIQRVSRTRERARVSMKMVSFSDSLDVKKE